MAAAHASHKPMQVWSGCSRPASLYPWPLSILSFVPGSVTRLPLLSRAIGNMRRRGLTPPILVGGAAVEFCTGGAVTTGDFDFVTPLQDEFFRELERSDFSDLRRDFRHASAFTLQARSQSKSSAAR